MKISFYSNINSLFPNPIYIIITLYTTLYRFSSSSWSNLYINSHNTLRGLKQGPSKLVQIINVKEKKNFQILMLLK